MKVVFSYKEVGFGFKIQISDQQGVRDYYVDPSSDGPVTDRYITAEFFSNDFDLMIVPIMPDVDSALNELETNRWVDRIVKKTAEMFAYIIEKCILRVGCNYYIQGCEDGDRLDLNVQQYVLGSNRLFSWFDILPLLFEYCEVSSFNSRYEPYNAFGVNRKEVIRANRVVALGNEGFLLGNLLTFIIFPFQMMRIRRLSRNKKIYKTIKKFHNMSYEQRQKELKKQERDL